MKKTLLAILCTASVCTACTATKSPADTNVHAGTGAVLNTHGTETDTAEIQEVEELLMESIEVEQEAYGSQSEALQLSYENAVIVRDIVADLAGEFDPEARDAIDEALVSFSEDIEALKYYVDEAKDHDLSADDTIAVAELSASIEEAMNAFAQIIELML